MVWHLLVRVCWTLLLGGLGLYLIAVWRFRRRRAPDETYFVKTNDGWDIALRRVHPRGGPSRRTPVIMQHGLGANHRNFDLNDRHSIAHFLARAGYDCFFADLRGSGDSAYLKWGHPDRWSITFEDFVEQDLPAVIDKVRELTGAAQVHFVGHSMGGMLGYAIAAGPYGARLRSVTSIAGPAIFQGMGRFKPFARFKFLLNPFPVLHTDVINRIIAPIAFLFPQVARDQVYWPNVERRTLAEAAVNIMAAMPRRLLFQFAAWVEFGRWGADRAEDYENALAKIRTPLYAITGTKDVFCPAGAIEPLFAKIGSEKKRLRVFALANGDRSDYGHGDLVIGRHAPDEIYPTILQWLEENDGSN